MTSSNSWVHCREWAGLIAAVALGPVFITLGYRAHLIFGASVGGWILLCALVVPIVSFFAERFKFLAWQVSIISIALSVIGDNIRHGANGNESAPAFVLWAGGTLLSSPLPIYFVLKTLAVRQRYLVGGLIALAALFLWFGIKRITG
jgi:hypothetical protein